jgi:hypothetical protein
MKDERKNAFKEKEKFILKKPFISITNEKQKCSKGSARK